MNKYLQVNMTRISVKLTHFKISNTPYIPLSLSFPTFISKLDHVHKFPSHRDTIEDECFAFPSKNASIVHCRVILFLSVYTKRDENNDLEKGVRNARWNRGGFTRRPDVAHQ